MNFQKLEKKAMTFAFFLIIILVSTIIYSKYFKYISLYDKNRIFLIKKFTTQKKLKFENEIQSFEVFDDTIVLNLYDKIHWYYKNKKIKEFYPTSYSKKPLFLGFSLGNILSIQDTRNAINYNLSHSGQVISTEKIKIKPSRIIQANKSGFLTTYWGNDNSENIYFYNSKDSTTSLIYKLPPYNDGGLSTDGYFIKNTQGEIAYVFYYLNKILTFSPDGKFKKSITTIDGDSLSKPIGKLTLGRFRPSKDAREIHGASAFHNQFVYVISNVCFKKTSDYCQNVVVDCYDVSLGKYINSFNLPFSNNTKINYLKILNQGIFLTHNNDIYLLN